MDFSSRQFTSSGIVSPSIDFSSRQFTSSGIVSPSIDFSSRRFTSSADVSPTRVYSSKEITSSAYVLPREVHSPDQENKNLCEEANPCKNGGTCEQDDGMGYKCICTIGFTGKDCDKVEWCEKNKGICGKEPCVYNEKTQSGFCSCKDGFYFIVKTKKCTALDRCSLLRISGNCTGEHEKCDSSGKCICEVNYAYNANGTACEPDFCWKNSKKPRCGANMNCTEMEDTYSCACIEGYVQIDGKCVKPDKCAPGISNCPQKCKDGVCSCDNGFEKKGDECVLTESPTSCSLKCGKGTCVKRGTREMCICPEISHVYTKKTCLDKCTANRLNPKECPKEVGCMPDEELGYKCNCTGKYEYAEDGVHCKDKLMCRDGGGEEDCSSKGGICVDNFSSTAGYECTCKFGYEKNKDTGVCEHKCKKADCDKKQAFCIINSNNKPECICPPLLVKDENNRCNKLATYSYIGDFSVPRNEYRVVTDEDSGRTKRDTLSDIDYVKLLENFKDSMDKIFDGYEGASLLNCTGDGEDWHCFLEMKLNKDNKEKLSIISTPTVCLPLSDEAHCLIQPHFVMKKREANEAEVFKKTHPCDKGVVGKLCGDKTECKPSEPTGFKCGCKKGYIRRTFFVPAENAQVDVCEDIDECVDSAICSNTTTCSNLPGDYTCKCIDGYQLEEGKSAKKDGCKDVCMPNPCKHGKCLKTGKNGFSCSCEGEFVGRFCNQTNEAVTGMKKKGSQISGIVGGVLGAFLVVAIIIAIILFRRLRKQKSIDDTEEYIKQRKRALGSEMKNRGRRHPANDDGDLRENERRPNRATEDHSYPMNPIDGLSNRPNFGRSADKGFNGGPEMLEKRGSGDYRKGYAGDDKMFPKAHTSGHSGEEARRPSQTGGNRKELSQKPLSKSSDKMNIKTSGVSSMQYRNRGYEED